MSSDRSDAFKQEDSHGRSFWGCMGKAATAVTVLGGIPLCYSLVTSAGVFVAAPRSSTVAEVNRTSTPAVTMADCAGHWGWKTATRTITFDLNIDGTFEATDHPHQTNLWEGGGLVNSGWGHWAVKDGKLTIALTHVSVLGIPKEYNIVWINEDPVVSASETAIVLKKSGRLVGKRRD